MRAPLPICAGGLPTRRRFSTRPTKPASLTQMPDFAEPLARLITEFKLLPGIGQKSAQRLAFHVLRAPREDAEHLARAVLDVKDQLTLCERCNNIWANDPGLEHAG